MTLPNSWDIETALIGKLQADAELAGLMPDGVWYGVAPPGAKQFVVVSLIDPTDDSVFGTRAIEDNLYLVKAVGLSTLTTTAELKAAAYRIDLLLQDQALTVNGYVFGDMHRDHDEPRVRYEEPIPNDPATTWRHGGGNYRVRVSLPNA
jgi:hypothetical protein